MPSTAVLERASCPQPPTRRGWLGPRLILRIPVLLRLAGGGMMRRMRWYVSRNGETHGPVEEALVAQWVRAGMRDARVRDETSAEWVALEKSPFAELLVRKVPRAAQVVVVVVGLLIAWWFYARGPLAANRAYVACEVAGTTPAGTTPTLGNGFVCSIEHRQGSALLHACWDISVACHNGTTGNARGCGDVAAHAKSSSHVPFAAFKGALDSCDSVSTATIANLKLTK